MPSLSESIAELCALTQLHLWQHYPKGTRIEVSADNFSYFKSFAQRPALKSITTPSTPILQSETKHEPTTTPTLTSSLPPPQRPPAPPAIPPTSPEASQTTETVALSPAPAPQQTHVPISTSRLADPPPLPIIDNKDLLAILKELAPHLQLLEAPEINHSSAPILILTFEEKAEELLFLQHIAYAIHISLGFTCHVLPAALWKAEKATKNQLILASASYLHNSPSLSSLYREDPKHGTSQLAKIPLLPLPDLSLQMRQPALKAALWQSICQAVARHVRD